MQLDACFQLGYVIKKHGLHGEVTALLDVDFPEEYSNLESVFVEINQKLVPFFIDSIVVNGNRAHIRFEGVETLEQAEDLKNRALYLPLTSLPELEEGQFYYHQVVGYTAHDKTKGDVGKITSVLSGPQQDLFAIDVNGKEALIPVNDELIVKIDHDKGLIEFDLPEGLLEIYLE